MRGRRRAPLVIADSCGRPWWIQKGPRLWTATLGTRSYGMCGGLHHTRPFRRKTQFTGAEALELYGMEKERTESILEASQLKLNLLEDPTAGLASGPAEELTPAELETRVRVLVSGYTPALYRLLYTPFVDVVWMLVKEGLVPRAGAELGAATSTELIHCSSSGGIVTMGANDEGGADPTTVSTSFRPVRPEEIMARWFTDGPSTLRQPHATAEAMGKKRWNSLCRSLEAHWAALEEVMPLTRVVRRHDLREDLYVPLLRQLAMELMDPTKSGEAIAALPGIILSLANGRAPRSLGLPENDMERVMLVSSLFLGVAQETGNTDLAYLAMQLLRANDMKTPFSAQKQLTNVFASASRIKTDWQMRSTSLLAECYPKWTEYFSRVQRDNKRELDRLQAEVVAAKESGAGGIDFESSSISPSSSKVRTKGKSVSGAAKKIEVASTNSKHPGKKGKHRTAADKTSPTRRGRTGAAAAKGEQREEEEAVDPNDDDQGSTEQYRYFCSRQQDDITRITALEQNIETALRSRASELRNLQENRRRFKKVGGAKPENAAASA